LFGAAIGLEVMDDPQFKFWKFKTLWTVNFWIVAEQFEDAV
jgi:hypothetical protein